MLKRREKPRELTPEEIEELKFKDWCGSLESQEIQIARDNGLLKWDLFVKCQKLEMYRNEISRLCKEKGVSGFNLAPRFNPDGSIKDPDKKYLIKTHAEYEHLIDLLAKAGRDRP